MTTAQGLVGGDLASRLAEVRAEAPGADFDALEALLAEGREEPDAFRDALSTRLMDLFRLHQGRACFGLLYELNQQHLLVQVAQRLRRYQSRTDPNDLLQEVFFNIYRYPRRFDAARDDAFRVWTAMIVRNTVLKHLRSLGRSGRVEVPFEDLSEHPETQAAGPLGGAIRRESEGECRRVYQTYLYLYLEFYKRLSQREQRALELIEIQGASYRDAAADLGIRLENLKMVVFRARRKIYKAMRRVFEGLPPELAPPRAARTGAPKRTSGSTAGGSQQLSESGGTA